MLGPILGVPPISGTDHIREPIREKIVSPML